MKNAKQTSPSITRLAAKTLSNPKASQRSKALAGSALAQAGNPTRKRRSAPAD